MRVAAATALLKVVLWCAARYMRPLVEVQCYGGNHFRRVRLHK